VKLSLRWIFDHIQGNFDSVTVVDLMDMIGKKVTEIEQYAPLKISSEKLRLAKLTNTSAASAILEDIESGTKFSLLSRPEAQEGQSFFIVDDTTHPRWATMADFGSTKETLMPAVIPDLEWKKKCEVDDVIMTISNTCITHRPDLWSHRGFAREVALLLELSLKPQEELLADNPIRDYAYSAPAEGLNPFEIVIETPKLCSRFAALSLMHVTYQPSAVAMAVRLARVDSRPINALVDLTNYVMLDWGQPMHVFDSDTFSANIINIGSAKEEQTLELLDGTQATISSEALIVKSGQNPLSLAGIMGSKASGITANSKNVFVEAAHFAPAIIRKTSTLLHLRTEASTRFEKDLDGTQTVNGIQRFLFLAQQFEIVRAPAQPIISLGSVAHPPQLTIHHAFFEKILGTSLAPMWVKKQLQALGFILGDDEHAYHITIPSWRTKDIKIEQDMAEEIGRLVGWDSITPQLPSLPLLPHTLTYEMNLRAVKHYWAYAARAHEILNYPVFEEELLQKLNWRPTTSLALANPVSQSARCLVTSLIPNLIKAVMVNSPTAEKSTNFFEINSVWNSDIATEVHETNSFAGISYSPKEESNFYQQKNYLNNLFSLLKYKVNWTKTEPTTQPWYHPYKTAILTIDNNIIGYAGIANPSFLNKVVPGSAFIFSIDIDLLFSLKTVVPIFKPLAKYPDTWLDISMLLPLNISVAQLETTIKNADIRIFRVELVDLFTKKEWVNQRSITMRLFAQDPQQTLTKEQIEQIQKKVHSSLEVQGVSIR